MIARVCTYVCACVYAHMHVIVCVCFCVCNVMLWAKRCTAVLLSEECTNLIFDVRYHALGKEVHSCVTE